MLKSWWRQWFGAPARRPGRRFRPAAEALEGRTVPAVLSVTSTDDVGPGTLRQALHDANGLPGHDLIIFELPGSQRVLRPEFALPTITESVTIDGATQVGYSRATGPVVVLDGSLAGPGVDGLVLTAGGCVVQALHVAGFSGHGLRVVAGGGNLIRDNVLGNGDGLAPGNGGAGLAIDVSHNDLIRDNVLGGNGGAGLLLFDAVNTTVWGNRVGTNPAGTQARPNTAGGVVLAGAAANNIIGGTGPGEGNLIAFNGGPGVVVVGSGNAVRGNAIFSNALLGIDLDGDGVSANDADDLDGGANGLLNFPTLSAVLRGTATTRVVGTYQGTPNESITLDFYAAPTADPSGHGQGAQYLSTVVVHTDAAGAATFDVIVSVALDLDSVVAATATDALGNTSEFCLTGTVGDDPANAAPVLTVPGPLSATEDQSRTISGISIADGDAGSAPLTLTLGVAHGTLTFVTTDGLTFDGGANGSASVTVTGSLADLNAALASLRYQGDLNYRGPDTLTLHVTDNGNTGGDPLTDSETIALTVAPANDAPTTAAGSILGTEDVTIYVDLRPLAADAETLDPELTYHVVTAGLAGTLTATATAGLYIFAPNANYDGTTSFTFFVTDDGDGDSPALNSAAAAVTVHVAPVNDPPSLVLPPPPTFTTFRNTPLTISGIRAPRVTDDAGSGELALTVRAINAQGNATGTLFLRDSALGAATLTRTGTAAVLTAALSQLTFRPTPGFVGVVRILLTLTEGNGGGFSVSGTLTVTVVNRPPIPSPRARNYVVYAARRNQPLMIPAAGLLRIFVDPDGDRLTLRQLTRPRIGGILGINPNTGAFRYVPPAHYRGRATFTIQAFDGLAVSRTVTITIQVL